MEFTHLDEVGRAKMVDVGDKDVTERTAAATALLRMRPETLRAIEEGSVKKGEVLAVARVAGIMAAKKTSDLIPLCHVIPIESVKIAFTVEGEGLLRVVSTVKSSYKTGVEMEALTAASVAALTVYDMCKAIDRGMCVEEVRLLEKSGGKSGDYRYEG